MSSLLAAGWVRISERRAGAILLAAALFSAAGALGTARLYSDLRADMSELLPKDARSARDAATITARVSGWAEETVALQGPDPATLKMFADEAAPKLRGIPEVVDSVEYRIDAERQFFEERRWLFPSVEDLGALRTSLVARLSWGAKRSDPAWLPADDDPGLQLEDILERIKAKAPQQTLLDRFPDGYFEREVVAPDGARTHALVMRVRLKGDPNDFPRLERLDRSVRETIGIPPAPLHVSFGGYVAAAKFEHDGLAEDLAVATILVMLAVAAAIAIYYRTWKAVPAIGAPLLTGTLATFGLADLLIGHLNSNTAFLGSIVIGNGINAGLILFARYTEERRANRSVVEALEIAIASTWLATLTASFAAAISYGSLCAMQFRGFSQFGVIGGIGMAACWLATYAITPALILVWERRAILIAPVAVPPRRSPLAWIARAAGTQTRAIGPALLFVAVAALFFSARFARDPIEYDFGRLRDSRALAHGGPAFWEDAVFGGHLDPAIVLGSGAEDARHIAAAIERARDAAPHSSIGPVLSIADLVPENQPAKLGLLKAMREAATRERLAHAPAAEQLLLQQYLPLADLAAFTAEDLPPLLRARLTERDGRIGTPVLVYPAPWVNVWDGHDAEHVAADLRAVPLPQPDAPMTSSLLVFADVLSAMLHDGPRATALSFAGVALLVLLLFAGYTGARGLGDALRVLLALCAGVLFFIGAAGALSLRLNMLSFIALPITFGIGVDYAANLVQRHRVSGDSWAACLRTTGGAVALCSLTTVIGYSSLLVAHNQALRGFGLLADLGEFSCLAAAFFVLPLTSGKR